MNKWRAGITDWMAKHLARIVRPRMIWGWKRADGVFFASTRISNTTSIQSPENFFPGEGVFIGHYNFIEASHGIRLGDGCQITSFVSITTHSSHMSIRLHNTEYTRVKEPVGYYTGGVDIGAYTFVGPHTVIMPGTQIGNGCIVAAYSLVKGKFPDFSIISGNPATVTGNVLSKDRVYLEAHPELKAAYATVFKDPDLE